jgi:opacity protein-like surface antigen
MRYLLGLVLFAILASASQAKGFYIGTYGGANWNSFSVDEGWIKSEADVGYVIGGVVGTKIDGIPGLRVEADLNYRSNDLDTTICDEPLIVTDETWALLGNIVYDIPVQVGGIQPYALAGLGYGSRTVSIDYTGLEIANTGLVWQVGAGLHTQVAEGVVAGVGYRYFDAPDFDVAPTGGFHDAGANHSVIAEVKFAFN